MRLALRGITGAGLLARGALAGAAEAQDAATGPLRKRTAYEDLQMFSQVLNQIRVNHPDSVDTNALSMAAVEGKVRAADPHSYVIPATRLAPEKERALRAGRLYPVPVHFAYIGGSPVVVSVAPGSAASRLDLLPGDELVAIGGEPVRAESAEELEIVLGGPKGSSVSLAVERRRDDGSRARLERTVKRERVEEASAVPAAFMMDPQFGYVRITTFANARAADDLHSALARLEGLGMRRLLLDLRDNGG
ncbi:MAG: PDZ domain-containing protein, partial [Gemmatimonadota bacterium]|nr:PDZ domain-containing protein [Gemmatimonadota bacterium]